MLDAKATVKWSEVLNEFVCTACFHGAKTKKEIERHLFVEHGVSLQKRRLAALRLSRPKK
jgi:hypothetical protein